MSSATIKNPEIECMRRAEIEQLQLERLQATMNRAYRNVAFYHKRFEQLGITPEDIQSREDLKRLPLTEKNDLSVGYPYGMFAVPLREVVRIHMSAGTTGHPSVVAYTANDLRHWTDLVARNLTAAGVTKNDVVQILYGYGLFTAGFGYHYGTEAIGASVIPVSTGDTRRQAEVMRDFRTTVIIGTPYYALRIADTVEEMGIGPNELSLRIGLFGDEAWSEPVREEIERRLYIKAFDIYGLAEIGGPGVSFECEERAGLHVAEDQFLVEVINPETGEVLGPGVEGELVFSTVNKEAFPLLRYRSGDLSSINLEPCRCGRTHARMGRVSRHTDNRIVVRGTNILPAQVEAALGELSGLGPGHQIVVDRSTALERLEVHVELAPESMPDQMGRLVQLESRVKQKLQDSLGLPVEVKLVEPAAIPEGAPRVRVVEKGEKRVS